MKAEWYLARSALCRSLSGTRSCPSGTSSGHSIFTLMVFNSTPGEVNTQFPDKFDGLSLEQLTVLETAFFDNRGAPKDLVSMTLTFSCVIVTFSIWCASITWSFDAPAYVIRKRQSLSR